MGQSMGLDEIDVTQEVLESVEDSIMENNPRCIDKRSNAHYSLLWTTATIKSLTIRVTFWLKGKSHAGANLSCLR